MRQFCGIWAIFGTFFGRFPSPNPQNECLIFGRGNFRRFLEGHLPSTRGRAREREDVTLRSGTPDYEIKFSPNQQLTYGVVREGVIAENFPQFSAKFPQTFHRISAPFRSLSWRNKTRFFANFRKFSADFPQTFRKNPFANDPISELVLM